MEAVVTQIDGFTYVTYREDKRPLKIAPYWIDGPESEIILSRFIKFVETTANKPEHVAKMQPDKFWALVERLSTLACREFSPTTNWGVTKPEVRGIVLFTLYGGMDNGDWPQGYTMTEGSFVQYYR